MPLTFQTLKNAWYYSGTILSLSLFRIQLADSHQKVHTACNVFCVQENILWRGVDCVRNSITTLARVHFTPRELNKLNNTVVLRKLRNEKNVEWQNYPDHYRFGLLIKKRLVDREAFDPSSNKTVIVKRGEYVQAGLNALKEKVFDGATPAHDLGGKFLLAKYANVWQDDETAAAAAASGDGGADKDDEEHKEMVAFFDAVGSKFSPLDYTPSHLY